MHRRDFLALGGSAALLCACGEDPPPAPTLVAVTVTGAPGMNPAEDGGDRPVTLVLLRLKDPAAFEAADVYALQADPAAAAGAGLVGLDRLVIAPGATASKTLAFEPEAVALGLLATFRDPAGKVWRLTKPVPPNATTTATVTLGPKGIELAMS